MPKEKANIKEILAANLKENRRKKGLTQEKLAEKADISLRYLAMLENGDSFPSGETLEKLAEALDIQAYELFYPSSTPEGALLHFEQTMIASIGAVVGTAVKESLNKDNKPENGHLTKKELEQLKKDIIQEIKNSHDTQ
ncbi:MAG: helix-turn-helix domain-containing protein [Treponema sp.]|jgi:transcriptional regulator with XRE-family HTH domain|nr:helix-turn-helix domain-containing protein [Treponema sp.]